MPIEHYYSITEVEEEVYDEIRNFMKCLVVDFDSKDFELIFFENAFNFKAMPHCFVEVVAIPRKIAARSEVYFKKGLEDLESEWSTHKKIIDISKDKGGLRK